MQSGVAWWEWEFRDVILIALWFHWFSTEKWQLKSTAQSQNINKMKYLVLKYNWKSVNMQVNEKNKEKNRFWLIFVWNLYISVIFMLAYISKGQHLKALKTSKHCSLDFLAGYTFICTLHCAVIKWHNRNIIMVRRDLIVMQV